MENNLEAGYNAFNTSTEGMPLDAPFLFVIGWELAAEEYIRSLLVWAYGVPYEGTLICPRGPK